MKRFALLCALLLPAFAMAGEFWHPPASIHLAEAARAQPRISMGDAMNKVQRAFGGRKRGEKEGERRSRGGRLHGQGALREADERTARRSGVRPTELRVAGEGQLGKVALMDRVVQSRAVHAQSSQATHLFG